MNPGPRPTLFDIVYENTRYLVPFANLFRPLNAREEAELRASIERVGVRMPVLIYASVEHGWDCVIDGANRLRIANESGAAIPIQRLDVTDDVARRTAEDLNIARRQVTPEEAHAARRERIERVLAARQAGGSLRVISDVVGVSEAQVRRDLATAPPGAVEPERVKGRNGRAQKAKRSKPVPACEPDQRPFADLMSRTTALATDLTRAVNRGDDFGLKLRLVMSVCGLLEFPADEPNGPARFLPLLGFRALLDLAGQTGTLPSERNIRLIYAKANGTWIPPLVAKRRAERARRVTREDRRE